MFQDNSGEPGEGLLMVTTEFHRAGSVIPGPSSEAGDPTLASIPVVTYQILGAYVSCIIAQADNL